MHYHTKATVYCRWCKAQLTAYGVDSAEAKRGLLEANKLHAATCMKNPYLYVTPQEAIDGFKEPRYTAAQIVARFTKNVADG